MSIDANETRTTVYEAECLVYHSLVSWRVRFPRGVNFRRDGVSENGPEYYFFYFWNFKKSKSYVPKGIIHTRWRSCLHSMLQTTLLDHVVSIFFFCQQWTMTSGIALVNTTNMEISVQNHEENFTLHGYM